MILTVPSVNLQTASLDLKNTSVHSAQGVTLSPQQQTLASSVLDLFAGYPSKAKLALWADNATFTDPLTIAQGRKEFEAQWYGLAEVFWRIELQSHELTSADNPMVMELRNKYTLKGIGKEQTTQSAVYIHTSTDGQRIVKVEDKWDGKLPVGPISKAFRRLNAVSVPHMVSVPKSDGQ